MNTETNFGDRLAAGVKQKNSAVCVGIDPRWESLPSNMTDGIDTKDLKKVAETTAKYCCEVIDATHEHTPIIKPQAAFFEQMGPWGMQALASVIRHGTQKGILVLLDAKRGDIGSTAAGYAAAYLGAETPWGCDALTVNPYLGDDTLAPFYDQARATGTGIFVLVKTSNPGSGFLQDREQAGTTIYQHVAGHVQGLAQDSAGQQGYGSVGAVVGATYPEQLAQLRKQMPNVWILIPGFGAQGGTASDVKHGFDTNGLGAIINSSRGIIFAYKGESYSGSSWQNYVSHAAKDMRDQLNAA